MSARARVYTLVGISAATAAGVVVALTALTANHPPQPYAGEPPFVADWTAQRALAQEVRGAIGSVARLRALASAHPSSAFVRVNLGMALLWRRDEAGAVAAWKQAKRLQPDTPAAVHAGDLLHPTVPVGLPPFEPSFKRATTPAQRLLVHGIRLQAIDRPISAERDFAAAVKLAPNNLDAQVAEAVGLYDKDRPALAFGRLGPLVRRFPHAQTVRFHIGMLSIWMRAFRQARRELRLAVADDPKTAIAGEARKLLAALERARSK